LKLVKAMAVSRASLISPLPRGERSSEQSERGRGGSNAEIHP
jgi:hypothetical protein